MKEDLRKKKSRQVKLELYGTCAGYALASAPKHSTAIHLDGGSALHRYQLLHPHH